MLILVGPACGFVPGAQDDGAGSTALLISNESDAEIWIAFDDLTQYPVVMSETLAAAGELVSLPTDGAIGYAPRPEEIIGSLSITTTADGALVIESDAIADLPWAFEGTGEYGSGEHTLAVTQALVDAAE